MISLSFLLLLLLNLVLIKTELKFVYEVFRHGARSPWAPGNKGINETRQDIYGEYWFNSLPGLESELTSMGMRQHYLLGYKMRSKYVDTGFLDKSFNMKLICNAIFTADKLYNFQSVLISISFFISHFSFKS